MNAATYARIARRNAPALAKAPTWYVRRYYAKHHAAEMAFLAMNPAQYEQAGGVDAYDRVSDRAANAAFVLYGRGVLEPIYPL